MTGIPAPEAASTRPVDLGEEDLRIALRVGQAWKELRRGAAMVTVRDWFYGEGDDALELGQVDTLDLLAHRDTWRMGDLAEALRVDPSTATRAVHRLVKAGLAQRTACRDDGRVVMVRATAAGLQRHEAIVARRRQALASMLGAFTPTEREDLADLLERFVAALDRLAADLPHE